MPKYRLIPLLAVLAVLFAGCGTADDEGPLVVYSGRSEDLVGPLIEQFRTETGIEVDVRYGDSTELAATIRLEGEATPADVFLAQDPASLGAVALEGHFATLPDDLVRLVPNRFSDPEGRWVGISGRARVVVVNPQALGDTALPESVWDLTDPRYSGIGIAPTNGSFLAFVAAMILEQGEERTLEWLQAVAANQPSDFPNNSTIVEATDSGEIGLGLVNHYYLLRLNAEQGGVTAFNHFLTAGDAGSLVMPSGAGILARSNKQTEADAFVRFLLSETAQLHFANETFEYPLLDGVPPDPSLVPISDLGTPDIDLSRLAEVLDRATELVTEAGMI